MLASFYFEEWSLNKEQRYCYPHVFQYMRKRNCQSQDDDSPVLSIIRRYIGYFLRIHYSNN